MKAPAKHFSFGLVSFLKSEKVCLKALEAIKRLAIF